MRCKAILFTPFWLSTSPLMKMAQFRFDDALIAGCEALEAGIAVPLIETLLGFSTAGDARNDTFEGKSDFFTD